MLIIANFQVFYGASGDVGVGALSIAACDTGQNLLAGLSSESQRYRTGTIAGSSSLCDAMDIEIDAWHNSRSGR